VTDTLLPPEDSSAAARRNAEEELAGLLVRELRSHSQSDREVFGYLQEELRRIARAKMRFERRDHTLQPTALVNEAFVKLFKSRLTANLHCDRSLVLGLVARAMAQVLNDYADAHRASKRGGGEQQRVPIDDHQAREFGEGDLLPRVDPALLVNPEQSEDILVVRDAIRLLGETSTRQMQVVQLQYYGGLTQEEIAAALEVSVETVKLDWRKAKAFLKAYIATTKT